MAASAPNGLSIEEHLFGPKPTQGPNITTDALIHAMLDSGTGISDLIFSPGRPPQVERHGELQAVPVPQCSPLHSTDTVQIARDLIAGNDHALDLLNEQGACDLSYSLPERTRFR